MKQNQQDKWKRDFLTIAAGQTVSLIGSAAVQFSLIGSLSSATMPLGLLIAGPIAESRGVSLWFFVSGIAMLLLTFVSALLVLPQKRDNVS